jgi:hypothetical protein
MDTDFPALCRMNDEYDQSLAATPPGGGQIEQSRSGKGPAPTAIIRTVLQRHFLNGESCCNSRNILSPVPCVFFFGRVYVPTQPLPVSSLRASNRRSVA